jgi:hypothetical protein
MLQNWLDVAHTSADQAKGTEGSNLTLSASKP